MVSGHDVRWPFNNGAYRIWLDGMNSTDGGENGIGLDSMGGEEPWRECPRRGQRGRRDVNRDKNIVLTPPQC